MCPLGGVGELYSRKGRARLSRLAERPRAIRSDTFRACGGRYTVRATGVVGCRRRHRVSRGRDQKWNRGLRVEIQSREAIRQHPAPRRRGAAEQRKGARDSVGYSCRRREVRRRRAGSFSTAVPDYMVHGLSTGIVRGCPRGKDRSPAASPRHAEGPTAGMSSSRRAPRKRKKIARIARVLPRRVGVRAILRPGRHSSGTVISRVRTFEIELLFAPFEGHGGGNGAGGRQWGTKGGGHARIQPRDAARRLVARIDQLQTASGLVVERMARRRRGQAIERRPLPKRAGGWHDRVA